MNFFKEHYEIEILRLEQNTQNNTKVIMLELAKSMIDMFRSVYTAKTRLLEGDEEKIESMAYEIFILLKGNSNLSAIQNNTINIHNQVFIKLSEFFTQFSSSSSFDSVISGEQKNLLNKLKENYDTLCMTDFFQIFLQPHNLNQPNIDPMNTDQYFI
jgi:hypothetical protein